VQAIGEDYCVQHHFEMASVQFVDHRFRIREHIAVPYKRPVLGIPSGGAESGAQINQRVARQLLFPERLGFLQHFLAAGERPMGLLITKAPHRRQLRVPGQFGELAHDRLRVAAAGNKQVQWQRRFHIRGLEFAVASAEIERAKRRMKEHRPATGADQPRNRNAGAVGVKFVSSLSAPHVIGVAAAVELHPALPHSENRPGAERERHRRGVPIDGESLHRRAVRRLDRYCEWLGADVNSQISCRHRVQA